ncbi:hypothetical protein [Dyella mobilis]|uniref:Uncharacterized protein n=1 Tax=Dyella mobilis TaxID=1849582 RepID=A0ABS2KL99_9GAMM|nr:hypothetical protein [Dyella mobilis]MBM7131864.1 hypothetical protein [Dyella mobilis]GLQ96153.1 hypothetical protein GCM10007863_05710 [Dyella mobilis]
MNISAQSLMLAISSMVLDRCRLLEQIQKVDADVDYDEHLSDQVFEIDKALNELSGFYSDSLKRGPMFPPYEQLVEAAESYWEEMRKAGGI